MTRKAIALLSGGLDSLLATRLVLDQGIEVEAINFYTGFCVEGHTHAIRQQNPDKPRRNNALWSAEQLGIPLHFIDIAEEYKNAVVLNPRHGYGKYLNPCLDCKVFMVGKALEWGRERGFDFIITGEVIGQRPKSQLKRTMPIIARESGAEDRLLRPLCAQLLPETLPEREGWVNRDLLRGFHGRNRTPQIELARELGFEDFAQPAGGCCFLTDPNYTSKLADLWKVRNERDYSMDDILLLKVGRHLRPNARFKVIVGREEGENNFLEGYRKTFVALRSVSHKGPLALIDGTPNAEDLQTAARLVARFGQGRDAEIVAMEVTRQGTVGELLQVRPMANADIPQEWYV